MRESRALKKSVNLNIIHITGLTLRLTYHILHSLEKGNPVRPCAMSPGCSLYSYSITLIVNKEGLKEISAIIYAGGALSPSAFLAGLALVLALFFHFLFLAAGHAAGEGHRIDRGHIAREIAHARKIAQAWQV